MKTTTTTEVLGQQALEAALKIINGAEGLELEIAWKTVRRAVKILGGSQRELFSNAQRSLNKETAQ